MTHRRIIYLGFLMISILLTASCTLAQNKNVNSSDKANKIDELISLYSDYKGFNGSVLVSHQGEIIYKKGFGWANMEWDIPNQSNTKFQIASITKPFTATLILQLVAENKIDLHEAIITYLPEYPKESGEQITIHHLLTHTSGLGREKKKDGEKYYRPKDMVDLFAEAPLEFTPGSQFKYSNSGYTLLGYIIESITGKSYEEVLQEKIFIPLQMHNSGFFRNTSLKKNMSSGYYKSYGDYYNIEYSDKSSAYAAGAIYSTVEDLFLFNQALYNESLLPKEYVDLAKTEHFPASFGGSYGYGWELAEKAIGNTSSTIETIGHSGTISGYCAIFTSIPSTNSSIILLNNTRRAYLNGITKAVTGILNDQTYDFPIKPLAQFMTEISNKEGIEKGILFYKAHLDDSDYSSSEVELIVAGYKLLHAGNAKDAAAVFKLSTEVFPDKDNPYDSYAEALMTLGENEKAIKNYKKSLELNPQNKNAIAMLKKLGVDTENLEIIPFDLINIDSTWGKEIFYFPLHFAKDIRLKGFEEAVFPKGWNDTESPNFWTYAFAWHTHLSTELTSVQLENYLKKYYDGLMQDVNKDKDLVLPKTIVEIHKNKDSTFKGTLIIYDAFVSKKTLNLNIHVSQKHCKEKNKSVVFFKISPKALDSKIWDNLENLNLLENICQ